MYVCYAGGALDQHLLFADSLQQYPELPHFSRQDYSALAPFNSTVLEVANVTAENLWNVAITLERLQQTGR